MSRPEGDSNPQPSDSCRMLKTDKLSGPDICCRMFFKHWLWRYRYFLSEVSIWYVNCVGNSHSYSTHERVFLWKCQSFWDRKCLDLRGTRTPNLRIHAECSNLLSYQGHTHTHTYIYIYYIKSTTLWGTCLYLAISCQTMLKMTSTCYIPQTT